MFVALQELVSWVQCMVTCSLNETCFVLVSVSEDQDLSTDPQRSVVVYFLEMEESVVQSLVVDHPCCHLEALEQLGSLEVEVVMEAIQSLLNSVSE